MDAKEAMQMLGTPQLVRLKALGVGIKVGRVLGARVLVKTVQPYTDMDRVEKEALLYIPKSVKETNTPMPTLGVVVGVGEGVLCRNCGEAESALAHTKEPKFCGEYLPYVEVNDGIMFSKFAGTDFRIENEDFRIVAVEEILCTIVDTKAAIMEVVE